MREHTVTVARSARYFTCGDVNARNRWLVLHGYGELASEFIAHFEDFEHTFFVAPEGLSRFYLKRHQRVGASWMTKEFRKAEILDYRRFLDKVCQETVTANAELTVMGFSQGVHTACRWVSHGPPISRLILWGSGLPGDLDETAFAHSVRSCGVTFVRGSSDQFVDEKAMSAELERIKEIGVESKLIRYDGGHAIDHAALASLVST